MLPSNLQDIGLTSIDDTVQEDIFIVGFPKSGHTWMQYLVAGLLFGVDVRVAPDLLINDLVPDIYDRVAYRRYGTPTFFKSHELPQKRYRRVIYLLRDGRDAIVSFRHYVTVVTGRSVSAKDVMDGAGKWIWERHVEAWLSNPYDADILVVKYEALIQDPARRLSEIVDFAQMRRSGSQIQAAVTNATFQEMRMKEEREGFRTFSSPGSPVNQRFFRRGVIGSYRDELSDAELDCFEARAGATMRRVGYGGR